MGVIFFECPLCKTKYPPFIINPQDTSPMWSGKKAFLEDGRIRWGISDENPPETFPSNSQLVCSSCLFILRESNRENESKLKVYKAGFWILLFVLSFVFLKTFLG